MNFGFMIGGSKYRIPQMEFWNQDGPYTVRERREGSRKTMHATARFLSQRNLVRPVKCANENTPTQRQEGLWEWTLHSNIKKWWEQLFRSSTVSSNQNVIREQVLSERERNTLQEWFTGDHSRFDDDTHPPDEDDPVTVLVWVRDWLENHQRTAVPR
jgi:hypothetical protein